MNSRQYMAYGIVLLIITSMVIAVPVKIYAQAITVSVDKSKYVTGDLVKIRGKVSNIQPGLAITIQILNANNARFDLAQIMQNEIAADGSFTYQFRLTGSDARLGPSGQWKVIVTYGSDSAQTTFNFEKLVTPAQLFVIIDGKKYPINATLTNGQIINVTADQHTQTLTFNVKMDNDGVFTTTLSRSFIDSRMNGCQGNDMDMVVLLDTQTEFPKEDKTNTTRTLTLDVPVDTNEITVIGTCMVPEFGIIAVLILAVSIGTIIVILNRNRLFKVI